MSKNRLIAFRVHTFTRGPPEGKARARKPVGLSDLRKKRLFMGA
jgi:hypothetical protein